MRILYLTHNVTWKGGGAFFRAFHQARYLVRRGHQVTVLSIAPQSRSQFHQFESEGVRIVETPDLLKGSARTGWDPWNTLRRIGYLKGEDYDLVHGLESRPAVALPALWLQRRAGLPVILDWADWYGRGGTATERGRLLSTFMHPVETFCEEAFHPLADGVVAMGEPLLERAAALGVPRDRMINLLHGCDPEGLAPYGIEEARSRLADRHGQEIGNHPGPRLAGSEDRRGTGLSREDYVLGYVGVMRSTTAQLLFASLPIIQRLAGRPVKVVCAGNHKLKDFRSYVPAECMQDVIETGWVDYEELNLYLSSSDVMVLPFQRMIATDSIWPSKLNDYLAVGRPTVATDMRILRPIYQRYDIGVLADDSPHAFAEAVVDLLHNPARRAGMMTAARTLAEGDLSWEHVVGRLEEFYIKLVKEHSR